MTSFFALEPMFALQRGATTTGEATGEGAAASGGADGSGQGQSAPAANPLGGGFIWIILIFFVMMIVMTSMAGRKQRKRRAELLGSLSRFDKVQTLGGVIGVIQDISDHEIVVESEGTRMRFSRAAVQQVLRKGKAGPEETPKDPSSPSR